MFREHTFAALLCVRACAFLLLLYIGNSYRTYRCEERSLV